MIHHDLITLSLYNLFKSFCKNFYEQLELSCCLFNRHKKFCFHCIYFDCFVSSKGLTFLLICFSIAADGVSVFDNDTGFFERFKNHKDDERGKEPELLITVSKGKNLQNALNSEKSKLKNCRLKCKFYPDSLKHGPKLKTPYIHCSLKGTTR